MAVILADPTESKLSTTDRAPVRSRSCLAHWLADALCLLVLAVIAVAGMAAPTFSPDSWSLFELSHHVFDDFYRVNTVRQFQFDSPYGVSFPPLYPVLLAGARLIYDAGIYTGLFLNVVIAAATLWQLKRLAIAMALPAWAGNVWMLLLLSNFDYSSEVVSAGTFPLAMLLVTILLHMFIKTARAQIAFEPARPMSSTNSSTIRLGIVAGLLCLARFDFLLVAIALGPIAWLALDNFGIKRVLGYYLALVVVLSPWCWYAQSHFGKPFVSDNSRTVLTAKRTYVMDYFDADNPPETIFNRPVEWTTTLVTKRFPPVIGAALSVTFNYYPVMLLGGALFGLALAARGSSSVFQRDRTTTLLLWFGVALSAQLLAVALTGYRDRRYFIPIAWFGTIVSVDLILRHANFEQKLPAIRRWVVPALTLLTLGCFVREVDMRPVLANLPPQFDKRLTSATQYQALIEQLKADSRQPRLLVVSGDLEPFQFGALTGMVTIPAPTNLGGDNIQSLISKYDVTHVLDADDRIVPELRTHSSATATKYPGMYKLLVPVSRSGHTGVNEQ